MLKMGRGRMWSISDRPCWRSKESPGLLSLRPPLRCAPLLQLKQICPTGTVHQIRQPFTSTPRERCCLFLSFSDISGICGNLSCLYNKATALCLWHHIHGNPNIACTGDYIALGCSTAAAPGREFLWAAELCEQPGARGLAMVLSYH